MRIATSTLAGLALSSWVSLCSAAALAQSKVTDDSVCDLSPGTTEELAYRTFISADAAMDQKALGYRRLASNFIAEHCSQGQTLILHSRYATDLDAHYLANLSADLCLVSDVIRTDVPSIENFTNKRVLGYELRCKISKFEAFHKRLQTDEAAESTASLIARLRTGPATATSSVQGPQPPSPPQTPKQDCGKLTLSAMMFGGGGCR